MCRRACGSPLGAGRGGWRGWQQSSRSGIGHMTPSLAQVRPVIVSALGAPAASWQRSSRVSARLGERVSGGGSAAAHDAEFVALGVGHHDPTTRRGLASVVNDPRTEEQYPVDFLIL